MPSLKLISATDTQYSAGVLKSLNKQRAHGLFCDVTIIIQDKKFRAHKTILSASSTYFHQLFTVAGQVIELNFIRPEIFEQILNYIYSSKVVRIRSDMLEELINAGQILGVKFIANLGLPLSQVKGLPGVSKETEHKSDATPESMPIITESFSISTEEFNQTNKPAGVEEDSDNDVVFVSCTDAQIRAAGERSAVIDLDKDDSDSSESKQNLESNNNKGICEYVVKATPPQKTHAAKPPFTLNSPLRSPDSSSSLPMSPARVPPESVSSTPTKSDDLPSENNNVMGVQKKHIATSTQQGDFKIKLLDVSEIAALQSNMVVPHTEAKKTVTLNTPTEMDSISSDCKVYANIGENTFDIVSAKEDPGEGGSKAGIGKRALMATPLKPFDKKPLSQSQGPNRKRSKTEIDDHYEVVMDGKTFYVCAVCKRPYVCVTSLRRHFNTHSWEKKYPCRFCDKVFAMAEYRTKHEVHHTGERRYQCLLCNEMFQNYQIISSHCKQVHNQDPSGRKDKDDANNSLYRLLPFKMGQVKNSWVTDEVPVISEVGSMHHVNASGDDVHSFNQRGMLNWDEIFTEPEAPMVPDASPQPGSTVSSPPQGASEFEYVTPETY
uniref:Zinc finger and BTB domain containing 33 n=1 Tax=Nothobranchius rachovii TaxID=451742 RepID=A0A1A8RFE5_9TELE